MQLINAPGKLVLPFANSGAKNSIPVASQIGIVAGAASLTDGFPPLTRTPLAAGGVPPSGLDMNGIIYELSAILRWANAGAGYVYDGTFAADSNVGGYPKGARVLRSDGLGYWFNTTDNNTTDPEAAGTAPALAGWVPDYTNGVTAVTMTGSNVTLTALQYGKPVIVISGLLTANLNLIFPSIAAEWTVINNTTGPYTVTCKTAAGTGVVVNSAQAVVGDGTNIYSAVNDAISLLGEQVASAAGTADALTATFSPAPRAWPTGVPFFVRAASANATTTPTFTPNSGTLAAKTIVKGANGALAVGDIAGAGHWLVMQYDATLDKVVLLNPATGVLGLALSNGQCYLAKNGANLTLSPKNGNKLIINGTAHTIPSAGVSLAATGLTPTTVYFIYAYMNAGTMTLEASATGHSTDATTGVEIKTGDATRTLVGQAYCTTGPAWLDDSANIGVLSWFNKQRKDAVNYFTANRQTASLNNAVEVNTEIRVNFIAWAGSKIQATLNGSTFNSGASGGATFVGIDGLSATDSGGVTAGQSNSMVSADYSIGLAEGVWHYSTLCGFVLQASTQTWTGNATQAGGQRCSNRVAVWG